MNEVPATDPQRVATSTQPPVPPAGAPERSRLKMRPLLALVPYVGHYRWRAVLALIALIVAAVTTLAVPIAVRRMIDFGFSAAGVALIDSYFSVLIAMAAVLALA